MNISKGISAICSLLLFTVGLDKFFSFLEPPCSLMDNISPLLWQVLGVIQIIGAFLIWIPKMKKATIGFFLLFMIGFTIYHLLENTFDIGGSAFMAVLFGLLLWNPKFLRGSNS